MTKNLPSLKNFWLSILAGLICFNHAVACDGSTGMLVGSPTTTDGGQTYTITVNICIAVDVNWGGTNNFSLTPSGGNYSGIASIITNEISSNYSYCSACAMMGCSGTTTIVNATAIPSMTNGVITFSKNSSNPPDFDFMPNDYNSGDGSGSTCVSNPNEICWNISFKTYGLPRNINYFGAEDDSGPESINGGCPVDIAIPCVQADAGIGPVINQCTPAIFNFTNTGSTGNTMGVPNYTYQWSFSSGASDSSSTAENPSGITWTTPGSASATLKTCLSSDPTCCDSTSTSFYINSVPSVVVTTIPATCSQSDGGANVSSSGGTDPYTYLWSGGETGASVSGLDSGNYSVTVTDFNGCTKSTSFIVGSDPGTIPTPGNRASINVTGSGATLKWDTVPDAIYYKVRYRVQGSTSWIRYYQTTNNFKHLTGLDSATVYEWSVRAFQSEVCYSNYSSVLSFMTLGGTCPKPRFPVTTNITSNSAQLNWSHPEVGAQNHYRVKIRKLTEPWAAAQFYKTSEKTVTAINLEPGINYNWCVRSSCNTNGKPSSNWVYAQTFSTSFGEGKVLSVEDPGEAKNFIYYPNPASKDLTIELFDRGNSTITISDIQGKVLIIRNKNAGPGENIIMDVKSLKAGFYFIRVQSESGFSNGKFVVER